MFQGPQLYGSNHTGADESSEVTHLMSYQPWEVDACLTFVLPQWQIEVLLN